MRKLYLFAIGGTGARVLKSLTMLLASGVKINATQVIPIIIDPDQANGDVNRTVAMLRNYQQIHNQLSFESSACNQFFATPIRDITPDFGLRLNNVANKKFRAFVGFDALDPANKAMASLLFSTKNLEAQMEVGFKGNPNIGSVVLNQFKDSGDYRNFAADFAQGDRIFIVSSIFGGTGASGFPLLVKNIREPNNSLANTGLLRDAEIGAITVLPYFGVKPDPNSLIDKATFVSKTKAALNYYKENVSGNNSVNALYYIGDQINKDQENHEGALQQRNEAHFVELASALAVVDFMKQNLSTVAGKAQNPIYREYGLQSKTGVITFNDLGHQTRDAIEEPLTQYALFALYQKNQISSSLGQGWAATSNGIRIDNAFLRAPFYATYLSAFNADFSEWLAELKSNEISFSPLNMAPEAKSLFEFVVGKKPKSTALFSRVKGKGYFYIDGMLNKVAPGCVNGKVEQKFMDMFYQATQEVVKAKY